MRIAAARPEPIPVYAEMSSINPVYLLPAALSARARSDSAASSLASLTMGAGQFCTNPGLVFAIEGAGLEAIPRQRRNGPEGVRASTHAHRWDPQGLRSRRSGPLGT